MTFIDWSDVEGMLGLLIDYLVDEKNQCGKDARRQEFLSELLIDITTLKQNIDTVESGILTDQLRDIYNAIDQEFKDDPSTIHVRDCIAELERASESGGPA